MLTEANINSAWQSVLPKRQDTKQALGMDGGDRGQFSQTMP